MQSLRTKPPFVFSVAQWMQRAGIRGGHRIEALSRRVGWLDVVVSYPLERGLFVQVPLAYRGYDAIAVQSYEQASLGYINGLVSRLGRSVTLIDCGADIGLMSCRLVAANSSIKTVVAFEPNPVSFAYLESNMNALGIDARAMNVAVSNFVGRAELRYPEHDTSDEAAFIEPVADGSIPVTTIDQLELPAGGDILLKIDVEGAELAVINGAWQTLSKARRVLVVFEAHREQVRRSGIDTGEIVRRLSELGTIDVKVTEVPERSFDWTRPFFDQVDDAIYNVSVAKLA